MSLRTRRFLRLGLTLLAAQTALGAHAQSTAPAPAPAPAPVAAPAQAPSTNPAPSANPVQTPATTTVPAGGTIEGTVKAGAVPLPGVSVTATNTLTGRKYSTATDALGRFRMIIPQNGRYVLRTELAAFAPETKEALLNAASHRQTADFALVLASRAQQQQSGGSQYAGRGGAQNLGLLSAAADLIQAGAAAAETGGASQLPTLASNPDFSGESVAVNGQTGTTNPFAGVNMDQLRQNYQSAELNQSLSGTGGPPQASGGGGFGGFGGGGGGRRGGGGFGNFRNFNPNQPHGAFFWTGGNGALNATDFPIRGQRIVEPPYAQNQFGLTYLSAPYIPRLLENDKNDFVFFTLSGQRSSSPFDEYGTVPTLAERQGNFSGLTTQSGQPVTIYDPSTGLPFPGNTIAPSSRIAPQATALLQYVPLPNLPGTLENYQRLTSAETNSTKIGLRFIHNFGGSSPGGPLAGMIRQYLGQGGPGLRQNVSLNYNYAHTAADELNLFPDLGGKEQMHQYSLQLGYTLGSGKLTNNFNANWNRTGNQLSNYFTNTTDVASSAGIAGLPTNPLLFGLPDLTLDQFSSLSEEQPNFQTNQTISLSEASTWTHKAHNIRFGGDLRRVHLDEIGNTNSTGTFLFTGLFTEAPGSSGGNGVSNTGTSGAPSSGSSLADLLLGLPQETTLQAPYAKSYLRQNAFDLFAQDDWRARANLTLLAGLRYEYFSPYSEKNDRLATLDVSTDFNSVSPVGPNGVGPYTGKFPRDLIYPEKLDFSPRLGFAWDPLHDTVVRGGYGINFANGQYAKFVQEFAFQPPFADVQTNEATSGAAISLANPLPAPQPDGNYAVNKNYRLPYVQVWNLNVQRTVPWGIVLNVGYSGSKGTRLDVVDAPGRTANSSLSNVFYDYEDSTAFSNYNALTVSARKRMSSGISLQARYTYSHSIDDASSIGGNGGSGVTVAQNWQDILAEESNSSFDIRNQLVGNFVYELPFGPDAHFLTAGWAAKAVENLSLSGTFDIASGEPLTPHYEDTVADVARGAAGSLRPDRLPGVSLTNGAGSLDDWFNRDAFAAPAGTYGTASRFSIPGPGTLAIDMSASKTVRLNDHRTFEIRATADNVFNTVQYSAVDTTLGSGTYGDVTATGSMRQFTFLARFRY